MVFCPRAVIAAVLFLVCLMRAAHASEYFAIRVVDEATGRGVPLVELSTTGSAQYVTDSAGLVAFEEPGLMNQRVFFTVKSHGYECPADGFGFHGQALDVAPGGSGEIPIKRINIAERLYRVTGGGLYRDSVLLGRPTPLAEPLLNAGVLGSDSVVNAVFNGRIYWFWGDTNLPKYPLGIFHVPGATSELPTKGRLNPNEGVNLRYIVDHKGQARGTCQMPGDGPTWIGGLTVLGDNGRERMFAHYVKVKGMLDVYAAGLCEFEPKQESFKKVRELDHKDWRHPSGHPVKIADAGVEYVCFAHPFPYTRVRATVEAYCNPAEYEAYTCLIPGKTADAPQVVRGSDGKPQYEWRRDGIPFDAKRTQKLVKDGVLKDSEIVFQVYERDTRKPIEAAAGSLNWNEFRKKWVMIVQQSWGTSLLGELWYAEAASPLGPWGDAAKIITHDNYSFYNPKQHPMFDQEGGRYIYLEGTYTTFFTKATPTSRYDYNQVMYRLDLTDPRLGLRP